VMWVIVKPEAPLVSPAVSVSGPGSPPEHAVIKNIPSASNRRIVSPF